MPVNYSAIERFNRLEKISTKLETEAERAIIFRNLFDRANRKDDVVKAFNNSFEVHGLNGITQILLHEMILILVKVHDNFNPNREDNLDRACLRHARHLLLDQEVVDILVVKSRARGRSEDNKAYYEQQTRELINKVNCACLALEEKPQIEWFRTLRDFRNNHLAHSLLDTEDDPLPKFGYITDLLDFSLPIISDTKTIVFGDVPDFEGLQGIYKDIANRFWTASVRGMSAKK